MQIDFWEWKQDVHRIGGNAGGICLGVDIDRSEISKTLLIERLVGGVVHRLLVAEESVAGLLLISSKRGYLLFFETGGRLPGIRSRLFFKNVLVSSFVLVASLF